MSTNVSDWTALLVMAVFSWLYSRWLQAMEPFRQRREAKAKQMAQTYPPLESETTASLRAVLAAEIRTLRQANRHFLALSALLGALFLGAYFAAAHTSAGEVAGAFLMVAWMMAPFLFARYEAGRISRQRIYDLVTILHKYQSPDSVGVLLEAMGTGEEATANLARLALLSILPKLKAADAPMLESRHRARLHHVLRGSNSEFILATLRALAQVGDAGAIPYVKRLTPCPIWFWNYERIEQAARQCQTALQERERRRQASQTLLRVPIGRTPSSGVLLRPAQAADGISPKQLLRAAASSKRMQEECAVRRTVRYSNRE